MKNLFLVILLATLVSSCGNSYSGNARSAVERELAMSDSDTVRIANEDVGYEIIIIEPGFYNWMKGRVRPRGYYSQKFLENRNQLYVNEWNNRVLQPDIYDPTLYLQQIDYNARIDYGYEVNYLLYYYFIYFQLTYNQQLTGLVPRI